MAAIHLPRLIEEKFDDLAKQVRRLWLVRGIGAVAIIAIIAAASVIILDRSLSLSTTVRWLMLAAWLGVLAFAVARLVIRPQRTQLTPETLAAAIETQFPSLSERLISVVELSRAGDAGHGSRQLMELLVRDTAQRTRRLHFERAAPRGPAFRAGLLAGMLATLAVVLTLFATGGTQRVKRFLLPWYNPGSQAEFAIRVSSGSPLVTRGESVTLTAYLESLQPQAILPEVAALIAREPPGGAEKKFPMTGDGRAAFHVTRPAIAATFDYCVEAGGLRSDWHTVTVVEPLELADGTAIAIVPPPYATPPLALETVPGLPPVNALQHSEIRLEIRLNRAVQWARLEWQPENAAEPPTRLPIALADDKRSASAVHALTATGHLRVTFQAEQGLTAENHVPLAAVPDRPPRFEKVSGVNERVKQVRPDDAILLEWLVSDDVRLESLVLEYSANGGEVRELPLPRRDAGSARAEGRLTLPLADYVKDGDEFRYRLRARDNRSVPAAGLEPQTTYFPEQSWVSFRISTGAESLERQEIFAQHDEIGRRLEEAAAKAAEARAEAERLKRELGDQPMLDAGQVARLDAARDAAQQASEELDAAAREASLSPELAPLAEAIQAAGDVIQAGDDALRRSTHQARAADRNAAVAEAEQKLSAARDQVAELRQANTEIAQNRADRRRLSRLAEEIERLAEAAEAATDDKKRDDMLRRLQAARDELRDLVRSNPALRRGGERSGNQRAGELATEAGRLRQEQERLNGDIAAGEAAARREALTGPAGQQEDLNRRAEELRRRTGDSARQSGGEPLDNAPFDAAGSGLRRGDSLEAMTEQEKAAGELDRLADALEHAAAARRDPREAARQLAQAQDELRKRMAETSGKPVNNELLDEFARRQQAIKAAVDRLSVPTNNTDAQMAKAKAQDRLNAATGAARNPETAAEPQREAAEALRRLAESLPSREERLESARRQFAEIEKQQQALQREIEEKLKALEKRQPDAETQRELAKRLAAAAAEQEKVAASLNELDAPGLDERRNRVAESARRAAEDLRAGLPQDIPASQSDLRRRMANLRAALEGRTPPDAQADELARRQRAIADQLQRTAADSPAMADLEHRQQEIAEGLSNLKDADQAERLSRTREAVEQSRSQFQKPGDIDELQKKARKAADELDQLADQLAGLETDRERIERLARQRAARAASSKENAARPTPPNEARRLQSELERELEDLKDLRSGPAQAEKKAAVDQLERLRRTPNPERAPGLQQAAAEALDQLAKKLKGDSTPRASRLGDESEGPGDAGGQLPSRADAETARQLAREQREIRDRSAKAAAAAAPDEKDQAMQAARQRELAEQAGGLSKQLEAAANAPAVGESESKQLTEAAEAAARARQQMEKAQREQQAGHNPEAASARGEALQALEQSQASARAAAGSEGGQPDASATAASKAATNADELLRQAGQGLGRDPAGGKELLEQAASQLGEAADQLGQASQPRAPQREPGGSTAGKTLTAADLPPDLQKYAGTPWGDLPGEVKSRIIQDLSAKYGEDYARVIKLYFEQLAEKK